MQPMVIWDSPSMVCLYRQLLILTDFCRHSEPQLRKQPHLLFVALARSFTDYSAENNLNSNCTNSLRVLNPSQWVLLGQVSADYRKEPEVD